MVLGHIGVDRKGLNRFLKRLNRSFPLQRAILFGSRARGDELVHSDYDLLLVSDSFHKLGWTERVVAVSRYWDLDAGLEALCYSAEEFNRKAREIGIVAEALREGEDLLQFLQ
jgi:predicted nucleotidyltransferase